jgi:hypothetical protein
VGGSQSLLPAADEDALMGPLLVTGTELTDSRYLRNVSESESNLTNVDAAMSELDNDDESLLSAVLAEDLAGL